MLIGYLHWDPNRAMFDFNLPFLGRPILWYGFLFALGFFIAYWVLVYLLHRYFLYHSEVFHADIADWPQLVHKLKNRDQGKDLFKRLFAHCSADIQHQIKNYQEGAFPTKGLQQGIVRGFNALIKDEKWEGNLSEIPYVQRQLKWFQRSSSATSLQRLRHRFALEQMFKPYLKTLKQRARAVAEKLTLYVIVGTLVGARIGDVLFYQDWRLLFDDPSSFIRVWEGGLASHGGAVGILCALVFVDRSLRRSYPFFSLIKILDLVVIPTAFAAVCIRLGNFFNQEILGKPTEVPWAVIFGHPADGGAVVPRHPVQLYEAMAYALIFFVFFYLWNKKPFLRKEGKMSGLFLVLTFTARFFLEYYKEEQSVYLNNTALFTMGQILSIPFIGWGLWLIFHRKD
ncbi:MAG: prolipoprotein diacylglyceryl transferase [Verrucomicrobia bacterium]|nr:prolipoprotein diacylglyceryl transferase [Verrucomicrobiota bacterium]